MVVWTCVHIPTGDPRDIPFYNTIQFKIMFTQLCKCHFTLSYGYICGQPCALYSTVLIYSIYMLDVIVSHYAIYEVQF